MWFHHHHQKHSVKEEATGTAASKPKKVKASSSSAKSVTSTATKVKCEVPHPEWFEIGRVRTLTSSNDIKVGGNCIMYWMSRDQRADYNWALLLAHYLATEQGVPVAVCFNLTPPCPNDPLATLRQYDWMIQGLKEVEKSLKEKHVPMYLLQGQPSQTVPALAEELKACAGKKGFYGQRIMATSLNQSHLTYSHPPSPADLHSHYGLLSITRASSCCKGRSSGPGQ